MSTSQYRLTVVICAATWFLIGMHSPVVHEIVDHGFLPHWSLVAILAVLILMGCTTLWSLLRRGAPRVAEPNTAGRGD